MVVYRGRAVMGRTLEEALRAAVKGRSTSPGALTPLTPGGAPTPGGSPPGPPAPEVPE